MEDVSHSLDGLKGKVLDEAAQTYALGVLEVDTEEDMRKLWAASFADDEDGGRELERLLGVLDQGEREELLRLALQAGVAVRPESTELLEDSVEQAGESLIVIELGLLLLGAALLLHEYNTKGRASEVKTTVVFEKDRTTVETTKKTWESSGNLVKALTKLGLGG